MSEVTPRFKVPRVECRAHLDWVASLPCIVPGCREWRRVGCVPHHVRWGATSGTGLKPPDSAAVSLCHFHHMAGHDRGWRTFERAHGLDLVAIAAWLAFYSRCLGILK